MDSQERRPQRADARRNRDLLLAAARRVFAERGPDAPLDEVARRAGVGNATMYRHFPTRTDLVIAVYADEVTALCDRGAALLGSDPPGEALFTWLSDFAAHVSAKRDLALTVTDDGSGRQSELVERWHSAMIATATALLDRARRAGAVRPGVEVMDLLTVVNGIALACGESGQADRLLRLVRSGVEAS
ncbi:TetR/AcrR family transcriptional regulator [Microbispora sp. NPDC049125]|uniref:TetR/AcrR family transcriptional regulator n=1 Tax=Microbispora sp. NPDC049125 TaxID=3154929 RepID=UPI003466D612